MRFARFCAGLAVICVFALIAMSTSNGQSAVANDPVASYATHDVGSIADYQLQRSDAQEVLVDRHERGSEVRVTHPLEVRSVVQPVMVDTIDCDVTSLEHRSQHVLLQSVLKPHFIVTPRANRGPAHPPSGDQTSTGDSLDLHAFNGS